MDKAIEIVKKHLDDINEGMDLLIELEVSDGTCSYDQDWLRMLRIKCELVSILDELEGAKS